MQGRVGHRDGEKVGERRMEEAVRWQTGRKEEG